MSLGEPEGAPARHGKREPAANSAVHMAAITQTSPSGDSEGRAYYDKKLAQGKTSKEAGRALKWRISDAIYRRLRVDAPPRRWG